MNATILYVQACKFMLSPDEPNTAEWDELFSLLPKLRQSLSCRVCRGLLIDPFGSMCCEHYVCRGCLKKKRSLNPGCRWCQNLDKLVEDKQIRIVLACYKKLCEYVSESSVVRNMPVQNGEYNKTLAILQEAITSPIDLTSTNGGQLRVPEAAMTPVVNSGENSKMADQSRDQTPALLKKPLSKRKVIQLLAEPKDNEEQPKKKKKKFFKGTCYTYKKKRSAAKMPSPRHQVGQEQTDSSATCEVMISNIKVETNNTSDPDIAIAEQPVIKQENEIEIIEIMDDICPENDLQVSREIVEHKQNLKATKSGKKKKMPESVKRQLYCRCGTSCKPGIERCTGLRCPCARKGASCVNCQCKSCANPYNDNNNNNVKTVDKDISFKVTDGKFTKRRKSVM